MTDFDIVFAPPGANVSPPYDFFVINFNYSNIPTRPINQYSFLTWVVSPSVGQYYSDVYLTGASVPTSPWTQGYHVFFNGCLGQPSINASFSWRQVPCTGEIQVNGNNTSPTAVHIWNWGDNRATPTNGALITSWDYYSPYTDNFGTTWPGVLPGTYTITHTVIDQGLFSQETLDVVLSPPCCGGTTIIPDGEHSGSYGSVLSGSIDIQGLFIVDQNFVFTNATVKLEPGAQIMVQNQSTLRIHMSTLDACSNMWKGIYVDAQSFADISNSTINDAQYAIYLYDGAAVGASNTRFDKNYVSIYVPVQSGYNNVGITLSGNTFDCNGSLVRPFTGQSPSLGTKSYAALEIHDASFNLWPVTGNNIINHNTGVQLFNSDCNITNLRFRNIRPDTHYGNGFDGSAIYSDARSYHRLNVTGPGYFQSPNFFNCKYGIYTKGLVNSFIKGNEMKKMDNGIRIDLSNEISIEVYSNHIQCKDFGVWLNQNDYSYIKHIQNNYIDMGLLGPGQGIGISANEMGIINSDVLISDNFIYLYDFGNSGIILKGTSDYVVKHNYVEFNNPVNNLYGIGLGATYNSTIMCNETFSANQFGNSSTFQSGILSSMCKKQTIECNYMDGPRNGIYFLGGNPSTDLKGNVVLNNDIGLHLSKSAIIDPQKLKGNQWPLWGTFATLGALNENGQYFYLSPFDVDNSTQPEMWPPTSFPNGWFNLTSGHNFDCYSPDIVCNYSGGGGDQEKSAFLKQIAERQIHTEEYDSEVRKDLEKYLYELLADNYIMRDTDSVYNDFYISNMTGILGELKDLKSKNEGFFNYGIDYQDIVNNLLTIDEMLDTIRTNDSLISESSTSIIHKGILIANNYGLRNKIRHLKNLDEVLFAQINIIKEQKIDIAKNQNNSLNVSEQMMQNEKELNDIYYSSIVNGNSNLSSVKITSLLDIANQCPIQGGMAVYKARGLYALFDPTVEWNDDITCMQNGVLLRRKPTNSLPEIGLFPNPTTGRLTVVYSLEEYEKGLLEVIDIAGKTVSQRTVTNKSSTIEMNCSFLQNGIYFVKLSSDGKMLFVGKLNIIK